MERPVSPSVLLVGLDGASFEVLQPLLDAGDLPTLGGLVERGAHGVLRSVVPPITPAAWSSFLTGKLPGKHGIYDFRVYDPRTHEDTFVTSRALRERTVWELLTAARRRVGVVGLPMMYPPPATGGTVVSGFDTPSTAAAFTCPPELRTRILELFPDYEFVAVPEANDLSLDSARTFADYMNGIERVLHQRTGVALSLMAEGRFDVFMVHYQDTDSLQHLAWRFIVDRERHPERWERVRQVYRRLDACLGELLRTVGADTTTIVLSDHGFGPHTGRVFPNVLLQRWGYLNWRGRRRARLLRSLRKRLVNLGVMRPGPKVEEPWEVRVRTRAFDGVLPLRWARTRAYVPLAEIYGLLYLNLRGRQPEGTVAPGSEQEALTDELRARLSEIRDPHDGAPVFSQVLGGAGLYPDDPLGRRPDLVLVPRPGYTMRRELNHRLWIDRYDIASGTHRPEGILIASGPGIRPGRLADDVDLVDLAPTLLAHVGLGVPADMDGRVLTELFVEPPAIVAAPPAGAVDDRDGSLSGAEEDQVVERLKALGYIA